MRTAITRFFRRRRRRLPDEPLYFTRLARKSDSEWRSALSSDPINAARWIYAAAVAGQVEAQLIYGQMLLKGEGCQRDVGAAFRWLTIAATNRHADAVNMLGRCYEHGWGVPADCGKAAALYREAADTEHQWAMFNLACLLLDGRGLPQDRNAAFQLFGRAERLGHMKSLNMLGCCHEHGWGCTPDMIAATAWYRRSAEAGDFRGEYRMAQLFLESGLRQEALPMLRRAIDHAPPALCKCFAEALLGTTDPGLCELGRLALARSNQVSFSDGGNVCHARHAPQPAISDKASEMIAL
jgi:TPR repeat protein